MNSTTVAFYLFVYLLLESLKHQTTFCSCSCSYNFLNAVNWCHKCWNFSRKIRLVVKRRFFQNESISHNISAKKWKYSERTECNNKGEQLMCREQESRTFRVKGNLQESDCTVEGSVINGERCIISYSLRLLKLQNGGDTARYRPERLLRRLQLTG